MRRSAAGDVLAGLVAGYVGSRAMDRATGWCWDVTGERARSREAAANPDGTMVTVGRPVAVRLGRGDGDDAARATAAQLHRGLGLAYGVVAALVARSGARPLAAGIGTGAAAFLLVDELTMSAVLPPPWDYPPQSHLRGAVGHLTHGAVAGLVLTAWHRAGR